MGFTSSAQKIGYIDYQKVSKAHPSYDSILMKLNSFKNEMEYKLGQENESFQIKLKEYQDYLGSSTIDSGVLQAKEKTLISMKEEFDINQRNASIQYSKMEKDLIDNLNAKINEVVELIAKEKTLIYIIDNSSGLLVVKDPKGDITELVMKKMGLAIPVKVGE